jgi:hypothetical protein
MPLRTDPSEEADDGINYYRDSEIPAEISNEERTKLEYFFPETYSYRQDDFPWLRTDGKSMSDDPLCTLCQRLNFRYLIFNDCPYTINLGTYQEAKTRNCSFCRLILESSSRVPLQRHTPFQDSDTITIRAAPPQASEGNRLSTISTGISRRQEVHLKLVLGIAFAEFHLGADLEDSACNLQSLSLDETADRKTASARTSYPAEESNVLVQSEYRPDMIKRWLEDCLHEEEAEAISPKDIQRLIDIRNNCIIKTVDIKEKLVFAALSYVWGKQPQQVTLRKSTSQMLHRPGSLSAGSNTLSNTIRDAMICCKDIDIPYLWVDALCIMQDSNEDKAIELPKMRLISTGRDNPRSLCSQIGNGRILTPHPLSLLPHHADLHPHFIGF